jgi:hypothetical protein
VLRAYNGEQLNSGCDTLARSACDRAAHDQLRAASGDSIVCRCSCRRLTLSRRWTCTEPGLTANCRAPVAASSCNRDPGDSTRAYLWDYPFNPSRAPGRSPYPSFVMLMRFLATPEEGMDTHARGLEPAGPVCSGYGRRSP